MKTVSFIDDLNGASLLLTDSNGAQVDEPLAPCCTGSGPQLVSTPGANLVVVARFFLMGVHSYAAVEFCDGLWVGGGYLAAPPRVSSPALRLSGALEDCLDFITGAESIPDLLSKDVVLEASTESLSLATGILQAEEYIDYWSERRGGVELWKLLLRMFGPKAGGGEFIRHDIKDERSMCHGEVPRY